MHYRPLEIHDEDYEPRRMPEPTHVSPGSLAKVEILRQRVERGEQLHHPDDQRYCTEHVGRGAFRWADHQVYAWTPGVRVYSLRELTGK